MRLPCVGIDISKDWFDAARREIRLRKRYEYSSKDLKLFLKHLKKHGIEKARFCMEATGLYYERLAEFLHAQGHEVVVVNPQCIKSYANSELRRAKSDPLDAELIQTYCEDKYDRVHLWQPLPEEYRAVREILRRRAALVEQRTAEKNRKAAGFRVSEVLNSIANSIEYLNQQIREMEADAMRIIKQHPELERLVNLVATIPGVSTLTAAVVLVEVPKVLWDGRLAATFAGVTPRKDSSGKTKKSTHMSRIGSSRLRHALYMPAVSAAHCNPILMTFYQRLIKRGLKKKPSLIAVMRKLLHLIFGIVRNQRAFDPQYEKMRAQLAA